MTDRFVSRVNLAQAALWTLLAAALLPPAGHFLFDEAYFYRRALEVAATLRPAAFGPPASGTGLPVPGGAAVDLFALPFLFTSHPYAGTIWVVLLSSAGALLFDRALARLGAAPALRLSAVTLFVWSVWHARFADRLWNPDLLLFASPLLLYATARLRDSPGAASGLAWGAAAGLCVQCHPSGLVPVCLCAFLILPLPPGGGEARDHGAARRLSPHFLWSAPLGLAAAYAPYLEADAPAGFPTLRAWAAAAPSRVDPTALRLALESFAIFPSHAAAAFPGHLGHDGWSAACALTFYAALVLTPFGFLVRGPWRLPCVTALVLVPFSIWASRRGFTHAYVVAAYPFFLLPAAAGLTLLPARARHAYLAAFAALGVALLVHGWRVPGPQSLAAQIVDGAVARSVHAPP